MKNKVVFITGGARGLGAGLAQRVVSAGGQVFVVDLNERDVFTQTEALGANAAGCVANVCSLGDIELAMEACAARFGRIDVVMAKLML